MVVFQRRIIYLPSVPPGSRNKAMTDSLASGMAWRAVEIQTQGKTRYTRQAVKLRGLELRTLNPVEGTPKVVVIYLQGESKSIGCVYIADTVSIGNAGTPLHRLPLFQRLLSPTPTSPHVTILAVAPRSFWLSTRTAPTERGVLGDYTAVFEYAREKYGDDTKIVLYGHSLGGAVALSLCRFDSIRSRIAGPFPASRAQHVSNIGPTGCILENPLPSIRHMVRSLYPQRWLPYHYLGPFVFDRWDSISAIRDDKALRDVPSLWIRSGSDEIIPDGGVEAMYASVEGEGKRWVGVKGALHDTAYLTREWKRAMDQFLADVTRVTS